MSNVKLDRETAVVRLALYRKGYKTPKEMCEEDLFVNKSTFSQWKRRHPTTFPKGVEGMYSVAEVKEWLVARKNWSGDSRMVVVQ